MLDKRLTDGVRQMSSLVDGGWGDDRAMTRCTAGLDWMVDVDGGLDDVWTLG